MAMVLLLVPGDGDTFSLGATSTAGLAALGVTHVSVLRDHESVGVVLEGWAFDPVASAAEVDTFVGESSPAARVLHAVAELSVLPVRHESKR